MRIARLLIPACALGAAPDGRLAGQAFVERIATDNAGRIVVRHPPLEDRFRNPWPAAWESDFWDRANQRLDAFPPAAGRYGSTYFENEKQSYPNAFIDFVKGNREPALKFLQADDNDPWNAQTLKVDWYACFTIRNQVRKYFFFGPYLDPAYRQRLFDSARIWTEKDPLWRPNPSWKQRQEGWTPETMNSWVDVRNTDNLRAMRECAVYLMAEETGNRETQAAYRRRIEAYVSALYATGMGEWDSANYLSHTMTGYLQLYDFAKDPQVRLLGKAALDFLFTAGAVKYYRGSYGGPNKRDYNNIGPYAGTAGELALYFGDCPIPDRAPYRDFITFVTSPYRPPEAVVHLARKNHVKPVEILASKPSYEGWFQKDGGEDRPAFHETTFIGHTYQVGTLPTGHVGDVNGFRLLADCSQRGADTLILATSTQGYKGISTGAAGGDLVAHYRNLILWMNAKPDTTFFLFLPKHAAIEDDGATTLIRLETTWLAIHRIQARSNGIDAAATQAACFSKGQNVFPLDHVWSARGTGTGACGLALEIGEPQTHGDFSAFRAAVKAKSRLGLERLAEQRVDLTGCLGESVGLALTDGGLPRVFRNGHEHDWKRHWALWAGADGGPSPVRLGWKQGTLRVEAGGRTFEGTLKDGTYTFKND